MKSLLLLLFTASLIVTSLTAQTLLVQPYLQDAEPQSIKIMWETNGGTTHEVEWGTTQNNLNQTVIASSLASSGTNLIHEVFITGLTADTRYYYRVVFDNGASDIFDFTTPPLKSSNQSFNLIAISDMQQDGSQPNKFQELVHDGVIDYVEEEYGSNLSENLGLVLIPGDLVVTGTNYSQWQNHFFGPAHPLFSHIPVYPVLGNHENNSGFYFQYFELPDNGTVGFEEHWWYKDYSNVRIIGLDSNTGYRIQSQLDWLEDVLDAACVDNDIDFVFTQLHHPHKSELWTPGEIDYTGDIIQLMELFTKDCNKPSIHFFGHTHGYSRGQSRDVEHLWVNVATAGGAIDNWGEFPNADYEEFNKSIDEYGFVVVNVEAGASPQFTLKRISRGDQNNTLDNVEQDLITIKKTETAPQQPTGIFPDGHTVNPDCVTLDASPFADAGDFHQATQWQVATSCGDFSSPMVESWKQHENWYNEVDTQAGDDLTDEEVNGLEENTNYCWRVRYRDEHLKWSEWSVPVSFQTGTSELTDELLLNPGGENGVSDWVIQTGTIESLGAGECNGVNPNNGAKYLAVGGLCDGNETSFSEVYQLINVTDMAGLIDNDDVEVEFGGYLSNFSGSDQPTMNLEYLDASSNVLSTSEVLTTLSSNWVNLEATEAVPVNTRTLKVILTGTRNAGTDNDSYFDDLTVRLDTIPGTGCSLGPLPVSLISFTTDCIDGMTYLEWEVADEKNLLTYQIERSFDASEWVVIGSKTPMNVDQNNKKYIFKPWENVVENNVYYRLEMIDKDGSSSHSPIIRGGCRSVTPIIKAFPNPISQNWFNLYIKNPKDTPLSIRISNLLGQVIFEKEVKIYEREQQIRIDHIDWSKGIYTITLRTRDWQWSEELLKE